MVKKNTKMKKNVITTIIIIVFIFIGIFAFNQLPQTGFVDSLDTDIGLCSGGWTTLSVSDINIQSIGDRIRVTGVAKGSECLKIELSQSALDAKLKSQGLDATRDITGEVRLLEYTKTFPIDKQKNPDGSNLYYSSLESQTYGGVLTHCSLSECKSKVSANTIQSFRGTLFSGCTCVYPGGNGIVGDFSAARSYGNFKVKFKLGSDTATLTREQQSINLGPHYIEWVGNLMNLDEIYSPQYDARLISSQWDLANDGAYNTLRSEVNNYLNCYDRELTWWRPIDAFDICKSKFDAQSNIILSNKLSKYKSDNSNVIYDADTDDNNLYVTLKATPFPAFILDLDAKDVGIVALMGDPDITQCVINQPDLKSGQNKVVNFVVKNDANANNIEFYASINCNQGIIGFIPNFHIDAYETKIMSAELIPVNTQENDLPFSCTLKVIDSKSGNSDSCLFAGAIKYESGIICQPNSLTCDADFQNVLKCTSDGKNKVLYKECTYGCEISEGEGKCKDKGNGNGECPIGQEWREEGSGLFGTNLFKKQAGCYTASWVFWSILISVILIILIIWISIRFKRPRQSYYSQQPRRRY